MGNTSLAANRSPARDEVLSSTLPDGVATTIGVTEHSDMLVCHQYVHCAPIAKHRSGLRYELGHRHLVMHGVLLWSR